MRRGWQFPCSFRTAILPGGAVRRFGAGFPVLFGKVQKIFPQFLAILSKMQAITKFQLC